MYKSILCIVIISLANGAKLPDYFKKCNRNDGLNTCIQNNIEKSWKSIVDKGDKSVKLNSLNPMKIKHIDLQATPDLKVILQDVEFRGFETTKLKSMDMDLNKNHLTIQFKFGYFEMIGKYDINGRILVLPIVGNGAVNLTGVNVDITYNGKLETIEKGNKKYFSTIEEPLDAVPEKVIYQLDNLFNGDVRLGTEMNRFLNENWKDVFIEVKDAVSNTIRALITTIVNTYLNNIPISELMD